MIGYLIVGVALVGTAYAAYHDSMTTEVADEVSFLTASAAIGVHAVNAFMQGQIGGAVFAGVLAVDTVAFLASLSPALTAVYPHHALERLEEQRYAVVGFVTLLFLLYALVSFAAEGSSFLGMSVLVGVGFFLVGAFFYLTGVWGGADAFVMGATGFALPYVPAEFVPIAQAPWPFQLTLMLNLFIIGTLYIIGFAVFQGLRSKDVMERLWQDMRRYWRRLAVITALYVFAVVGVTVAVTGGIAVQRLVTMARYVPLLIGLLVLYRYLKIVEDSAMTEEVPVDDLEPGDVIVESVEVEGEVMRHQSFLGKILEQVRAVNPFGLIDPLLKRLEGWIGYPEIVGLTEKEITAIRERRETVTRKTGVRFVPAFPAAIVVSVTVGDLVYLVVSGAV